MFIDKLVLAWIMKKLFFKIIKSELDLISTFRPNLLYQDPLPKNPNQQPTTTAFTDFDSEIWFHAVIVLL